MREGCVVCHRSVILVLSYSYTSVFFHYISIEGGLSECVA